MTDVRLRELERRFKESGLVEDEAAYLRARVQAADLDEERLRRAAYVGHPAAREALGADRAPALPASESWEDMFAWVQGFKAWDAETSIRVGLAAVQTAWAHWEELYPEGAADTVRAWLQVAADWAECPCEAHRASAQGAAAQVIDDMPTPGGGYMADAAGGLARMAAGRGFWIGIIANSREGPGGRITGEVLDAIRERVGPWVLYEGAGA